MATEIELKFFIHQDIIAKLPEFLAQWSFVYQGKQALSNTYYETDDHFLRRHRLGLRIRTFDDQYEMTLKTNGKVVAGLHQRPEYNISLTEPKLSLQLLPRDIWPLKTDVLALEKRLNPLFSTNFVRESWLIHFQDSAIELALDRGNIRAGESREPLNEIELELKQHNTIELDEEQDLKQGTVQDVLLFAQQLCQLGSLRLSSKSKAARGYGLAEPSSNALAIKPITVFHELTELNIEQALQKAIENALSYWQYHEEIWLTGSVQAKAAIQRVILLLQQILTLWQPLLPKVLYKPLLSQLEQVNHLIEKESIEEESDAENICYQAIYTSLKLSLTQWVVTPVWRDEISVEQFKQLSLPFAPFAKTMLTKLTSPLKSQLADSEQVSITREQISNYVLSIKLLAGAYSDEVVADYLSLWRKLDTLLSEPTASNRELPGLIERIVNQPKFW